MKLLRRTLFGNPILRQKTTPLTKGEIRSNEIQKLIQDMFYTLQKRRYGVGLAAPQIGKSISLAVIDIKPTPTRPDVIETQLVVINPKILETFGEPSLLWEGCISLGSGGDAPYAKVKRFSKIKISYLDANAKSHQKVVDGLLAHVFQHEIDHLNGILFVDRLKNASGIITRIEYKKLLKAQQTMNKR